MIIDITLKQPTNKNIMRKVLRRPYPNTKTMYVVKPMWYDSHGDISTGLKETLDDFSKNGRLVQKITIAFEELTRIDYIILPNRWVSRLYDNGFLKQGTL